METKRQELEARIAELRKRVNLLEGCYTRSYSKANENAKAKHKARIQRLCTDLGFPSTAGQWTAHTALAAAEREREALDAPYIPNYPAPSETREYVPNYSKPEGEAQ